jgi:hypothetical protein
MMKLEETKLPSPSFPAFVGKHYAKVATVMLMTRTSASQG